MRLIRPLSIRTKLIVLATASGCVALLLCCVGFVVNDIRTIRSAKIRELETRAAVLAFNSTAVLTFQDAGAAERLLASLAMQPSIELACLYDAHGRILATYEREGHWSHSPPAHLRHGYRFTQDGYIELAQQVLDEGEAVGTLYLLANMDDLKNQLRDYAKIATIVMFCSLTVSIVFSAGLQRTISGPILALAGTSQRITSEGDYSIRVEARSRDELGILCRAFNAMLSRIEASERALQRANDQLEERVSQRTAELEEEISQRNLIQADLERSRDVAEAASRAKTQFLANMSHEIRTPMNAILGFTDLLRKGADGGDEAERRDYLDTIHTSGKHLLGLINDMLDLSKIEAGVFEVDKAACSPHEIIAEVVSVLRVRAQERGLRLDYEWFGGVPETIQTDPTRLRELLMNLVGNAVKFTRLGHVQVLVRLIDMESEPKLEIRVIDTGMGIARENLDRIFEPFMQADNSVTREYGGTGLGLAICRRTVEALGGTLRVESEWGKGSVFTVVLDAGPLDGVRILTSLPSDGVRTKDNTRSQGSLRIPGARILLVEDGDTNRKLISVVLRRAGAEVSSAVNGQIGVELAMERAFDLILMDMQMPVMDGYTATARLRQQGATIPIVALTAHAMKGDREKCEAVGCTGYLTKPVDPDVLLRAVADTLGEGKYEVCEPESPLLPEGPAEPSLLCTLPTDDPEFREVAEVFVERFQEKLAAMEHALAARDLGELAELTHWLKGAGGTAGYAVFTEPARRLEALVEQGQWERIEAAIAELAEMAGRIVIAQPE